MATSKEARESPSLNSTMPRLTCPKNASNSCQVERAENKISKDLLSIEHNDRFQDDHIANLFSKQSAKCDNKPGKIHRLPQNPVLSRLRSFLPQMKKANDEIDEAIASGVDVDIENVDESEQFIEMNVALFENEEYLAIERVCESEDDCSDSESDLENDSSDSESDLENKRALHRPKHARKVMIEEMEPSTCDK